MVKMWLILILGGAASVESRQFTREPTDTTTTVGDKAVLRCGVDSPASSPMQWTKDGFALGLDRSLPEWPNYSMLEDKEGTSTNFDLIISPVSLSDDALYQCQGAPLISKSARLHVLVPPSTPLISIGSYHGQGTELLVEEGVRVELTCQAQGRPQPEVTIAGIRDNILGQNSTTRLDVREKLYRTTSVLIWIPSRSDDQSKVTCTASNGAASISSELVSSSSSATVRLKFRPRTKLLVLGGEKEGDTFTFRCKIEAFPPVDHLEWRLAGRVVEGESSGLLRLESVSRDLQDVVVQCRTSNTAGEGRAETRLSIKFPPVFTLSPASTLALPGQKVTLSCEAKASPNPTYNWTREGKQVGTGRDLHLVASTESVGDYQCHAWAEGFSPVSSVAATVRLISPPVVSLPQLVLRNEGEDVTLECKADSASPSLSITWVRDGQTIRGPQVTVTRGHWTATSQLRMEELREEQFGRYGCLAESDEGPEFRDFRTVSLELAEDPVSVTVVLVVSGFLVLTLLVLGLAGYIVLMNRQKKKVDSVIIPPLPPPAQNRYGKPNRLNNDEALFADLLSTKVKGVPGDLLIPTAARLPGVPNPREVVVEATRDSRRSSLLSSVELDTPTENKTLSPGYYCQTASAAPPRTDSPVPSDSGIYSPPTSILPFLEDQEDLLPKLMKPKENWNETNEAINKVETSV